MVDRVVIDALGQNLKAWASEDTAKKMVEAIQKLGGQIKTQADGSEKNQVELLNGLKGALGPVGAASVAARANANAEKKDKAGKKVKGRKQKGILDLFEQVPVIGSAFRGLRGATGDLTASFVSAGVLLAGAIGTKFVTHLDASRKFYERGIILQSEQGDSIAAAGFAADNMNLTVSELVGMTKEYGMMLRLFDVVAVSKATADMASHLKGFAVTTYETTELMADYLETQRLLGFTESIDNVRAARFRKLAMEDTIKWSRVLGKTRKEIQEASSKALTQPFIQSWFRNSEYASESVRRFASVVNKALGTIEGGEKMAADIMDMVASSVPAANKTYRELLTGGAIKAAAAFKEVADIIRSGKDPTAALGRFADALTGAEMKIAFLQQSADGSASSVIAMSNVMGAYAAQVEATKNQFTQREDDVAKGAAAMSDSWREFKRILDQGVAAAFGDESTITFLQEALKKFQEILDDAGPTIKDFIKNATVAVLGLTEGIITLMGWFNKLTMFINRFVVGSTGVESGLARLGLQLVTMWGVLKIITLAFVKMKGAMAGGAIAGKLAGGALGIGGMAGIVPLIGTLLTVGIVGAAAYGLTSWVMGKFANKDREKQIAKDKAARNASRSRTVQPGSPAGSRLAYATPGPRRMSAEEIAALTEVIRKSRAEDTAANNEKRSAHDTEVLNTLKGIHGASIAANDQRNIANQQRDRTNRSIGNIGSGVEVV